MSVANGLLLLRVISVALLLVMMGVIFAFVYRDFRVNAALLSPRRRQFGRLVALRDLDGRLLETGEVFPLLPLTSLGRAPTNTVPLNDNFASNEHAQVMLRDGQWWLEDRHSRNGTLLNDLPISDPVIITQGDVIRIGAVMLRLELEG